MTTLTKLLGVSVVLTGTSILSLSCMRFPSADNRLHDATSTSQMAISESTAVKLPARRKIKIALLLDTSNSMDGLIDQAKAQLWKLVNELMLAKDGDEKPELEIALYEYGNDGLPGSEGYIRQVTTFTNDLDLVSQQLFALTTNGGSEFCGEVIANATRQLEWAKDSSLQMIFIAGNESFYQGRSDAKQACLSATEKSIFVNTIFCGRHEEGINSGWKTGAMAGNGSYMSIEPNLKTEYVETPYDAEIAGLNDQLNDTYVSYGSLGKEKKANQLAQDKNAGSYGRANVTSRVVTKSGKFYNNEKWDMVDASKRKEFDVTKVAENDLPDELKGKTAAEKKAYVEKKKLAREQIAAKISELNVRRMAYIAQKNKETKAEPQSLDVAMIKAIHDQAAKLNFVFENK